MNKIIVFALVAIICAVCVSCVNKSKSGNNDTKGTEPEQSPVEAYYLFGEENDTLVKVFYEKNRLYMWCNKDVVLKNNIAFEETYRLSDEPTEIWDVKGNVKKLYIGDIGQDYNPILCVLYDNGKVGIMHVYGAIQTGDTGLGILNMTDIVDFRSGGGGPIEGDDGEVFYEYTTIYAIDKDGVEHEIQLYFGPQYLSMLPYGEEGKENYRLTFTADWKMVIEHFWKDGSLNDVANGFFWPVDNGCVTADGCVYRYEAYEHSVSSESSNSDCGLILLQGEFALTDPENGVNVSLTPNEGDFLFGASQMGETVNYTVSGNLYD